MSTFATNWPNVDTSERPQVQISYLELAQESIPFKQTRELSYQALAGASGAGVDVGCGLGLAVHEMTLKGFNVTGIDLSTVMINEARRRHPGLDFRVQSALELPFEDNSLGFYRAERVYVQLTGDQVGNALSEACRILRPGGRIVLAEPDLETIAFTTRAANRDLARIATNTLSDTVQNGRAGSFLKGQLAGWGFENISVTGYVQIFTEMRLAGTLAIDVAIEAAMSKGYLSQQHVDLLYEDMATLERANRFQFACTAFIISANRPSQTPITINSETPVR